MHWYSIDLSADTVHAHTYAEETGYPSWVNHKNHGISSYTNKFRYSEMFASEIYEAMHE
jgi:hypothetical protein